MKASTNDSSTSAPNSPEEFQQTIDAQQRTIERQQELLRETFRENELLRRQVLALEQQLLDRRTGDGYDRAATWISKIVFILRQQNRPLRSAQLIGLLEKREPALAGHHNKTQYFSAFLNKAVNYGRVVPLKVKGVRGYYYLLPQWFDDQTKVKLEYLDRMM